MHEVSYVLMTVYSLTWLPLQLHSDPVVTNLLSNDISRDKQFHMHSAAIMWNMLLFIISNLNMVRWVQYAVYVSGADI